jgi:spore coat polysaccharide biosynthesis protein SpsF (cytidylyltransferase family)
MRVVAIVQARMTSSRLPGKILLPLGDKTVLGQVLTRCKDITGVSEVCCAIPVGHEHDILLEEIQRYGCAVSRGSETNVLERYNHAAKQMKADIVMRITSDCPLISVNVCNQVLEMHLKTGSEYTCNNMPPSWPHGYDCEVFNASILEAAMLHAESNEDREHVTPWMRRNCAVINLPNPKGNQYHHRITLDTLEDYSNLVNIFSQKELFLHNVYS